MKKLCPAILLTLLLSTPLSASAEADIRIGFLMYGYMEAVEFCTYRHHGSYDVIAPAYERWHQDNDRGIKAAFIQLEQEAAVNPVKAKKLATLETSIRSSFQKDFLEMPAEQTAGMCFTEDGFLERFDSNHLSIY
jgi:hypothetical protein